jgi:hypothetical protein
MALCRRAALIRGTHGNLMPRLFVCRCVCPQRDVVSAVDGFCRKSSRGKEGGLAIELRCPYGRAGGLDAVDVDDDVGCFNGVYLMLVEV